MKLFVDTEFTDFVSADLISLGAITEDGREFYAELVDYNKKASSNFVKKIVEPSLIGSPFAMTRVAAAARLWVWLEELDQPIEVVSDSRYDWELFTGLLEDLPPKVSPDYIFLFSELNRVVLAKTNQISAPDPTWFYKKAEEKYSEGVAEYFSREKGSPHVAINDARALREGWIKANDWLSQYY